MVCQYYLKKRKRFIVVIIDPWALSVENLFCKDRDTFLGLYEIIHHFEIIL